MRLSRRGFIQRSSAMAAASILPIGCSDSSDHSQRDSGGAIIIGSGFVRRQYLAAVWPVGLFSGTYRWHCAAEVHRGTRYT